MNKGMNKTVGSGLLDGFNNKFTGKGHHVPEIRCLSEDKWCSICAHTGMRGGWRARARAREASVPLCRPLCSLGLFHKVLKTGLNYHTHSAL